MSNLLLLLLVMCPPECSQAAGKHLLRFLTFCQRDVKGDGQYDIEFDGDQLFYVDPVTYQAVQRLPEFAQHLMLDLELARDTYVSLGTCKYNIPRASKGENYPPEALETEIRSSKNVAESKAGWRPSNSGVEIFLEINTILKDYNTAAIPTSMIYPELEMELEVPNTLICHVNNFHPPTVAITWTRNGQLVDESEVSQTQYYSNSDFSFRISSYLDFTPQEGDIYSCSVDHISLQEPLTTFWEVADQTDHQVVETAVCVGGVILGLIGVVTGLWFIMKANKSCQA